MRSLPPLIANQLRHDVPNRGKRKRLAKDIHGMLRTGNTASPSQAYSNRVNALRTEGQYIPNRETRRGSRSDRRAGGRVR